MKFDLKKPCADCPFRTDVTPYLHLERAEEIVDGLTHQQQTFTCHKTNSQSDDGETIETEDSQHCAGALIMLEKMEQPNQMMRWMERIGYYDRTKLDMQANVYGDGQDMLEAYEAEEQ